MGYQPLITESVQAIDARQFRAKVKITTPDIRAYFAVSMLFDYIIYEGYSALLHEVDFQKAGTGIISWKLYQQK